MLEDLKHRTILLLEDNEEFAENITVLLQFFVHKVYHATDITKGRKLLKIHPIDIIISDIRLKSENGLDFIREFREQDPNLPIIIISGHKDEEFLFRAIPLNLMAYLLKPIKYKELTEALRLCSEKLLLTNSKTIELKDGWYYDMNFKVLRHGGEIYKLNKKETLFMELLANHPHQLITKDMINDYVWEFEEMSDSAVTNFILRIRRRFGKSFVYTVPELGYLLKR